MAQRINMIDHVAWTATAPLAGTRAWVRPLERCTGRMAALLAGMAQQRQAEQGGVMVVNRKFFPYNGFR